MRIGEYRTGLPSLSTTGWRPCRSRSAFLRGRADDSTVATSNTWRLCKHQPLQSPELTVRDVGYTLADFFPNPHKNRIFQISRSHAPPSISPFDASYQYQSVLNFQGRLAESELERDSNSRIGDMEEAILFVVIDLDL